MWGLLTSVIGNLFTKSSETGSSKWIYIAFAVAILGVGGWGYYEMTRADNLEVQVQMLTQQVKDAKTLDELNKQIATANQAALNAAIDRQNEMFDKLAKLTNEQSQNVLNQLEKSQAATTAQYSRVTAAIGQIKITSCEGLMEELTKFPTSNGVQWSTK